MYEEPYIFLKNLGYKYIARERIGGESAHKETPIADATGYHSNGWRYVWRFEEIPPVVNKGWIGIDEAIERAVTAEIAYRKQKAHDKYIKRTNKMITECAVCGSKFVKRRNPSRYCSERCRSARTYIANCRKHGKSDDYMLKSKSNYKKEIMMLLEREKQKGRELI